MSPNLSSKTYSLFNAIKQVVGSSSSRDEPIGIHEPFFQGTQAWVYVKDCLDTGWVSTAGTWVSRFEQQLCDLSGASHAVAVTNGTVALRLALHLVGVRANDEVLLPPLSFVATANAVAHLGAVPHFIDVDSNTLGLSPIALNERLELIADKKDGYVMNKESGRRIAAILPVHVFGNPCYVDQIRVVADSWGLPVVEDAAEALASFRNGIHCGLFGKVGTLSFNGNKLITTGGGGALLTNDASLAQRARHLSTTAKHPHPWAFDHDAVAWNDRLPNLNAALGVAQLEDIDRRLNSKQQLAQLYAEAFSEIDGVELISEPPGCKSNHWLVTLRFTDDDPCIAEANRLELLEIAHSAGYLLRPIWTPLHQLPMFCSSPMGSLVVANDQGLRLVNLPSSPHLHPSFVL